MKVNSINNTQSFGMACAVTETFKKAVSKCSTKQLTKVRVLHDTLQQAPQDFILDVSKKGKAYAHLINNNGESVTKTAFNYANCKPSKVVKKIFKDMGNKYSAVAKAGVEKDMAETMVSKLNLNIRG